MKQQEERSQRKIALLEDELSKLTKTFKNIQGNVAFLQGKLKEMEIVVEEQRSEIKIKEGKHTKEIDHFREVVRSKEMALCQEIEAAKAHQKNLTKELDMRYKEAVAKDEHYKLK